jgi:hypothetical protein
MYCPLNLQILLLIPFFFSSVCSSLIFNEYLPISLVCFPKDFFIFLLHLKRFIIIFFLFFSYLQQLPISFVCFPFIFSSCSPNRFLYFSSIFEKIHNHPLSALLYFIYLENPEIIKIYNQSGL